MHPSVQAWYERHPGDAARARVEDPHVQRLLAAIAPGVEPVDLGGEDGLNLHLPAAGVVLRVHKRFVTRRRLVAERALREHLRAGGLRVPRSGGKILRCGDRWAELAEYVPLAPAPPLTAATAAWHFRALGALHRGLATASVRLPTPLARVHLAPRTMRRMLDLARPAADPSHDELAALLIQLSRQWVPASRLPRQLVHGDAHRGNLVRTIDDAPVYLDFGGAIVAPRVHDLGYALAHLMYEHGGRRMAPAEYPWPQLPDLVDAYEVAAATSLRADEHRALAPYTAAVALAYDVFDWADKPWRALAAWLLTHAITPARPAARSR